MDAETEDEMSQTIVAHAGLRSDGSVVREELLVKPLGPRRFRLLKSPGLVLGVAADDIIEVDETGVCKPLERGRNVCVQVFTFDETPAVQKFLTPLVEAAGGRLDGCSARQLVFTFPVSVGFAAIEAPLKKLEAKFSTVEWVYGNVYGDDGVTPLNWWS